MCRVGKRWELLYENALPKDCCIETAKMLDPKVKADKDIFDRYSLSRACVWWQCQTCKRTHPYDDPKLIRRERRV